jgi:hypothetical protein
MPWKVSPAAIKSTSKPVAMRQGLYSNFRILSGLDISADPSSVESMIDMPTKQFKYLSAEVLRHFNIMFERAFDEEPSGEMA